MKKKERKPPCLNVPDCCDTSNHLIHKVHVLSEYSLPIDKDDSASLEGEETATMPDIYMLQTSE